MPYYTKKDLPGIPKGTEVTEIKKPAGDIIEPGYFVDKDGKKVLWIPPAELDEWIEETDEKQRWKPSSGDKYFCPDVRFEEKYDWHLWNDGDEIDNRFYSRSLVCRTEEEAIALCDKMLKAITD